MLQSMVLVHTHTHTYFYMRTSCCSCSDCLSTRTHTSTHIYTHSQLLQATIALWLSVCIQLQVQESRRCVSEVMHGCQALKPCFETRCLGMVVESTGLGFFCWCFARHAMFGRVLDGAMCHAGMPVTGACCASAHRRLCTGAFCTSAHRRLCTCAFSQTHCGVNTDYCKPIIHMPHYPHSHYPHRTDYVPSILPDGTFSVNVAKRLPQGHSPTLPLPTSDRLRSIYLA